MASELSGSIAKRMLVAKARGAFDQEYSSAFERLRPEIDEALMEVREVLDLLQNLPYQQPPCFCRIAWQQGHDGPCQRARALYEKLRTDK